MWSARQLAIFCVAGTYAGSGDSDCGAFNMYVEPAVEVCADEFCSKLRIECPVGYTSSYDGSIKCKGGVWKGLDVGEVVTCNMDYKMCDYDKLAATSDDVKTKCDGNACSYSCKDGSEVSVASASCDTQFGTWKYDGQDSKPGKVRCAGIPKAPKEKKDKSSNCAPFDAFDADSVNADCNDKRCSFECKEGFHSISSADAKCKSAGFWKLADGAERVTCFPEGASWMNEWRTDDMDFDPPFECDPKDLRRVSLTNCYDVDGDGAITNCDVMCRGVKIDDVRCINYRPKWSNEYFDC